MESGGLALEVASARNWCPFRPFAPRDLTGVYAGPSIVSPISKEAYELRVLGMLLPAVLLVPPLRVTRRESPDFEITAAQSKFFVEIVDAVPDAVSPIGTMNITERRSRPNVMPYHVDADQFATVIAREISKKRGKALRWQQGEPELQGRLVLLVNGGQGPKSLGEYFRDINEWCRGAPSAIDPFIKIVVGDETGAFVRE